ncbi:MAG: winged helix-turn-helix transcriptional regulator [Chloroflexi bacterium]|nr:winged helix-turn-helix transcriptional regulator [Chloroflexota bacterium]
MAEEHQERLYDLHATICKTFANPLRLHIVDALKDGEITVSELATSLGVSRSNVSQHLGLMREKGMVESRRSGGYVFYRLSSPKILQACRLMREVLLEQLERAGELSRLEREA